jgi:hypothetical protein
VVTSFIDGPLLTFLCDDREQDHDVSGGPDENEDAVCHDEGVVCLIELTKNN